MSAATSVSATDSGQVGRLHSEDHHFDPEDTVIHVLRRAIAHRQDLTVALAGIGELWLFPSRGECFARIPGGEARFYSGSADDYEVRCLNPGEIDARAKQGPGRNIDEIMWKAGFHVSRGRLIRGCLRDDVVELRHWPNLTRVPTTPNALAIAALLTRYPTSITFAGRLLKVPASEMFQFYTAAHCAGLAHVLNRTPEMPKLPPHRNRTLLASLLTRIAGM